MELLVHINSDTLCMTKDCNINGEQRVSNIKIETAEEVVIEEKLNAHLGLWSGAGCCWVSWRDLRYQISTLANCC